MRPPVTLVRRRDGTFGLPAAGCLLTLWLVVLAVCAVMGVGIGLALACEGQPKVKSWQCETRYVIVDGKRHIVRECANR